MPHSYGSPEKAPSDKEVEAERKVMRDRLGKLPENKVTEAAKKMAMSPEEMEKVGKEWEPVHKIMDAAYNIYKDGELSFAEVMGQCAEALRGLGGKEKKSEEA